MINILFVDDDLSMKFIIEHFSIFHCSNFRIKKFVTDGIKALQALDQQEFDLVITDIKMPIIDGIALLKKMREKNDETFVIIESTYREFKLAQEAMRYHAIDYIEKPLTEVKLREALTRAERMIEESAEVNESEGEKWINQTIHALLYEELMQIKRSSAELQQNEKEILADLNLKDKVNLFLYLWHKLLNEKNYIYNDRLFIRFPIIEDSKMIFFMHQEFKRLDLLNHDPFILKLSQIINDHITLGDLITHISTTLELSKDYVSRTFRQKTSMTLKDYIIIRKILEAQRLLTDSNKKVYQISNYLGYMTVDYFSGVFKKVTGMTPIQYRKHSML
ncbi:response regulator [Sporolactobacillus terrae]|uniref:response regulator n=1 Tax=Sporolactobacillus terrae TaxID=269673 RepID=UPI00111AA52D|nr:response regulator [Sporolactobacillus terrae]